MIANNASSPAPVCLVVLGMHRSGTSALAGLLSIMGAQLPSTLMAPHESNPKGFFESTRIRDLNDLVLAEAGSGWKSTSIPDLDKIEGRILEDLRLRAIEEITAEFGASPLIVLKDPRICRLLPFWRNVLLQAGYAVVCVHTHRNPLDVISSLQRRYGMDPELVARLWLQHQVCAENATRGLPRFFTSFDRLIRSRGPLQDFVATTCNIPVSKDVEEGSVRFLSRDLINHVARSDEALTDETLSEPVRDAFSVFEGWADQGEGSRGRDTLDLLLQSMLNER